MPNIYNYVYLDMHIEKFELVFGTQNNFLLKNDLITNIWQTGY